MQDAYIGIGSNVGDRLANIAQAVDRLSQMPASHVKTVSTAYISVPWGKSDQPNFGNAVAVVQTELTPGQLLDILKGIEREMGREPGAEVNGPRVIDLDILLLGSTELNTPDLVIPHPRLLERDFVVTPLLEVYPHAKLPDGTRVARADAKQGKVLGELGCVPDWGEEHDEPIYADHWVAIAQSELAQNIAASLDPSLLLKREVLEQAGIPLAWDPYEPGATADPWGAYTIFSMLVPAADAERARRLLDEALSAPPQFPADLGQTQEAADAEAEEAGE